MRCCGLLPTILLLGILIASEAVPFIPGGLAGGEASEQGGAGAVVEPAGGDFAAHVDTPPYHERDHRALWGEGRPPKNPTEIDQDAKAALAEERVNFARFDTVSGVQCGFVALYCNTSFLPCWLITFLCPLLNSHDRRCISSRLEMDVLEVGADDWGPATTGDFPTGPPMYAQKRSYPHTGSACIWYLSYSHPGSRTSTGAWSWTSGCTSCSGTMLITRRPRNAGLLYPTPAPLQTSNPS